ncbi:MAG: nucleotidyltransferase [Candidatus Thiodiazotropha sp.]
MSVNSYLTSLANAAIIRDQEQGSIRRSVATLQARLNHYFEADISQQVVFGSYSRGTILPRSMDANSDVDYMVVFTDNSSRPQTYLNRLRRFVGQYYSRSEISQSNPTIVLSLNHIRFELVPAINSWFSSLQIPAKASEFQDWMDTDPNGFNQELVNANQTHSNLIKPLVRVMKYWNAKSRYPFESYSLEQDVVRHGFGFFGFLSSRQLQDYFYDYIEEMDAGLFAPKWKQDAVSRAQQIAADARSKERQGYTSAAESAIKRLLPPLGSLV